MIVLIVVYYGFQALKFLQGLRQTFDARGLRQNRFEALARSNRASVEIGDFAGFVVKSRNSTREIGRRIVGARWQGQGTPQTIPLPKCRIIRQNLDRAAFCRTFPPQIKN
jgi:hypothetical protein